MVFRKYHPDVPIFTPGGGTTHIHAGTIAASTCRTACLVHVLGKISRRTEWQETLNRCRKRCVEVLDCGMVHGETAICFDVCDACVAIIPSGTAKLTGEFGCRLTELL